MKNYVFTYHSNQTTPPTPEALATWGKWFETLGDSLVDSGNPITSIKVELKDGKRADVHDDLVGYSIVKAENLDKAVALVEGNPLASAPGCAVRVYETGQM